MCKNPVFWLEVVSALLDVTGHDQLAIIVDALTIIALLVSRRDGAMFITNRETAKQLVEIDEYVMA